ncbi:TetR/AcrR family transcriptional regulator [Rhodococcus triatomae]|uniref:DNA-binding transcriptional regulator, AcrR family n=2 Tax=Rhodococcus triatomae TaxID=300028 RepID=A0A1G8GYX7_9NOCA|nr:TetR/AcrR family transcriptional regulator [Rhodococcus triatomae]QNG25749.1 TetR/AcrR family transcriptional regulator [Rhodococcus triatomae]SDH99511.1 DNA-binding transcriptional regulator, AcrR family [Rhodococcus triatomae]
MASADLLRALPVTRRGLRTRSALVAAARTVFERSGYLDARLADITQEAKCSSGTFYTYFASKEEIFAAVLEVAQEDMLHPGMAHVDADDDAVAVIEASNRAYFAAYERNARLMALLEQVANIDPGFRKLRQERADAFVRRNARSIADLQARGVADTGVDPLLASSALSGMISRLAFSYFVVAPSVAPGETTVSLDDLVRTATRLWANALRLPMDD